ncbi:MAG: hypothetical protein ACSLEN_04420 [Candidatus Malihini olakiniferum]
MHEGNPSGKYWWIGGGAFNVARVLTRIGASLLNGMSVGQTLGQHGRSRHERLRLLALMRHPNMDNGWCLALLAEPSGERTFISITGCEGLHHLYDTTTPTTRCADTLIYANGYELFGTGGIALRARLLANPQQKLSDFGQRLPRIPLVFTTALFGSRDIDAEP